MVKKVRNTLASELDPTDVGREIHVLIQPTLAEEDFRHSGWADRRRKVFDALRGCGFSPRRQQRFACCGALAAVWWNDETGELQVRGSHCHDRMCRPCATARGLELTRAITMHIPESATLRFVTLTITHAGEPLAVLLQRLRGFFTRLRNRKFWKDHVAGGVQVLEPKLTEAGQWHPHIHLIYQGYAMPWRDLQDEWRQVTGGSFHVDIRVVHNSADGVADTSRYLTKYITKSCGASVFNDPVKLREYMIAMKGSRTLNFLGSWRGIMDEATETAHESLSVKDAWHYVDSLTHVIAKAAGGDESSRTILLRLSSPPPDTPPPVRMVADPSTRPSLFPR